MRQSKLEKQVDLIPKTIKWCKKCIISNQRPRIIFDKDGVCSGCRNNELKQEINWKEREKELEELLNRYRSKDGNYDVIVPSSGGKDSGYVAHQLKYKYNMNPLTVTWSPLEYTNIGLQNLQSKIDCGFNNILFRPNTLFQKKLARLCLEELGDAFHVFVLGQVSYPFHIALKMNIKLVFYGENGELEYAGDPKHIDKPYKPVSEWLEHYFKGSDLNELIKFGLKEKDYLSKDDFSNSDLVFYKPPSEEKLLESGIKGQYFYGYYKKWIPQENYYYVSKHLNFKPNPERTEGTYSKYASLDDKFDGMHYYMRYIKFGLGRCVEDASHEIRDGHLTREEAISLAEKYEGEFPKKYYNEFLKYLNITDAKFWEIVDSWRPPHLWEKKGNYWRLKNSLK